MTATNYAQGARVFWGVFHYTRTDVTGSGNSTQNPEATLATGNAQVGWWTRHGEWETERITQIGGFSGWDYNRLRLTEHLATPWVSAVYSRYAEVAHDGNVFARTNISIASTASQTPTATLVDGNVQEGWWTLLGPGSSYLQNHISWVGRRVHIWWHGRGDTQRCVTISLCLARHRVAFSRCTAHHGDSRRAPRSCVQGQPGARSLSDER